MDEPVPVCRWCGKPLHPLHGHEACLDFRCPLCGIDQDECCQGLPDLAPDEKLSRPPPPIPYKDRDRE